MSAKDSRELYNYSDVQIRIVYKLTIGKAKIARIIPATVEKPINIIARRTARAMAPMVAKTERTAITVVSTISFKEYYTIMISSFQLAYS